jgi:hypothetical protein
MGPGRAPKGHPRRTCGNRKSVIIHWVPFVPDHTPQFILAECHLAGTGQVHFRQPRARPHEAAQRNPR